MSLKEALMLLSEKVAKQNAELPFLVNTEAFKAWNPDMPDIYDTQIRFPPYPRKMSIATALGIILSQVPDGNACYIVRNGLVEVTTNDRASIRSLLQERVQAAYMKKPLGDALDEIADATGLSVVIDPHVEDKMKTPVSVCFRGDVAAETALRLLADMVELKVAVLPSGVYVTTPANADRLQREQKRWLVREPNSTKRPVVDPFQ
jgi:hypothetical protein